MRCVPVDEVRSFDTHIADAIDADADLEKIVQADRNSYEYYESYYANYAKLASLGGLPEKVEDLEWSGFSDEKLVSLGDELCWASRYEVMCLDATLLCSAVPIDIPEMTVVEVGCGNGRNLHILARSHPNVARLVGMDMAPSAVKIAQHYTRNVAGFHFGVGALDDFVGHLPALEGPLFVVTRHAIEQSGSSDGFLAELEKLRDSLIGAALLEPSPASYDLTMPLGRARARHSRKYGFNEDLERNLHERMGWRARLHVFGVNPLNPTSVFSYGEGGFVV